MRTYVGLFAFAALITLAVTPYIARLGRRLNAYGGPHTGRETRRIPRLGGLAIFLATLISWGALLLLPNTVRTSFLTHAEPLLLMMVPAALILVLGMIDDLAGTTPWQKLGVQVLAAGLVWWAGFRVAHLPFLGYGISQLLSFFFTVLWIVAVTNSLNLIDGLDGLAAGISLFVTLTVFFVSLLQENVFVCTLTITLAGALLGFLKFNFSPATIFLGDTGSLFLGFFLAVLSIQTSQKSSTLLAVTVPFLAFGLPLLETALSVVRRFLGGRSVFGADLDHIHHRLLQKGLTPRVAVLLLYGLGALFSLGSLLILHSTANLIALVAVLAGTFAWFMTSQLQYDELSELNVYVARAVNSQRRVLANQILIRKLSRQIEESPSLEDGWKLLTDALEALDFDRAECRIAAWPASAAPPALGIWDRGGAADAGRNWRTTIPLGAGDDAIGELELRRSLDKDRLLFQFSSLLDTLVPSLEKQLVRRADQARLSIQPARPDAPAADASPDSRPRAERLAPATEK